MTNSRELNPLAADALKLLYASDSFAAVEFLNQQPDETAVAAAYRTLQSHSYWITKEMTLMLLVSHAGIQYCLDRGEAAAAAGRMAHAFLLRGEAKALAYDLASFCWPGWDEPGVQLDVAHRSAGGDAARLNLRLALELDKPPLALGRAYWLLAAYLLIERQFGAAAIYFYRAAGYAAVAQETTEELLFMAYAALAAKLTHPQDKRRGAAFAAARKRIQTIEFGKEFLDQIDTAAKVAVR